MGMAVFSIILLAILSIVSNSGATATANIDQQFDKFGCPMPAFSGLWNNTGVITYTNYTYNYEAVNLNTLTLTCSEVHTPDGYDYQFGIFTIQPFFSNGTGFQFGVPMGWAFFVSDWLSEAVVNKLGAFFTIVFYILTPANLNILGFTIADISGFALMAVIGLYAVCYIFIGVFIYKTVSPFSGVG